MPDTFFLNVLPILHHPFHREKSIMGFFAIKGPSWDLLPHRWGMPLQNIPDSYSPTQKCPYPPWTSLPHNGGWHRSDNSFLKKTSRLLKFLIENCLEVTWNKCIFFLKKSHNPFQHWTNKSL